jgi:hypothetical protein
MNRAVAIAPSIVEFCQRRLDGETMNLSTVTRVIIGIPLLAVANLGAASATTVELIADAEFRRGVRATEADGADHVVQWWGSDDPVWRINHHHSQSSFLNRAAYRIHPQGFVFEDEFSSLVVHPVDGSADIVLGVNASREFGGAYRKAGEPWPHAYLTQRISAPRGHLGAQAPAISELEAVDFTVDVRLLHDRRNLAAGHNASIHAAQFVCFFTLQNLNRQSPGFGDYCWFGVLLYDDRHLVTRRKAMRDRGSALKRGTEKLIYDVGIAPFTLEVVGQGNWVSVRGDLLPHFRAGLREAWKQGYLPASQDFKDYRVGGLVIGWEVTGLNEVAMAVRGLRATGRLAAGPAIVPNR